MNNYIGEVRKRGLNLLIVEGCHERNKLFWLVLRCFPEIDINMDNVLVYGTNIYMLYDDIEKEYGEGWVDSGDDIDLPYIISKKQHFNGLLYKNNFKNIIMVFDYERHDTKFSEDKIMEMQRFFMDAADMGKLYINYPMIESYMHLHMIPDANYANRKIPVSLQPGKEYKSLVRAETGIAECMEFAHRVNDLLKGHFGISDGNQIKTCCEKILNISDEKNLEDKIEIYCMEH